MQELCGFFGKLPQQADFVSRYLPEDVTEYWRAWLQAGISVSPEQLLDDWLELYLTSPIWRFAISAGVCSDAVMIGVLMPSVDEVGRYFPLTIAHIGQHQPWAARLGGDDWYRLLERIALSALDPGVGYLQWVESLESLPQPEFESLPAYRTTPSMTNRSNAWAICHGESMGLGDMAHGLLEQTYGRLLGRYSLWWTAGSELVQPCTLVSAGLPEAGQFAALLDGDWKRWDWSVETVEQPLVGGGAA